MDLLTYRREAAVYYAHQWAYSSNPAYYDYDAIGGDCTNFVSQCLYAGTDVMNFTPIFGWYYIDADNKAPAWTGVEFLRNFLVREAVSPGPTAFQTQNLQLAQPGDVIQMLFSGDEFQHSAMVVSADRSDNPSRILVAAHSFYADFKPLSSYSYQQYRLLHINGYYQR